jgi:Domain of unknown function (DUF4266)
MFGETSMRLGLSVSGSLLALVLACAALNGCGGVPAYARGRLAHPSMTTADLAGVGEQHARAVQEGAIGGGFEAGGGCGCN